LPPQSRAHFRDRCGLLAAALLALAIAPACPSRPVAADRAPRLAFEAPCAANRKVTQLQKSGSLSVLVRAFGKCIVVKVARRPAVAATDDPGISGIYFGSP